MPSWLGSPCLAKATQASIICRDSCGVVVREDDQSTGERPGVLLRGAQPAPSA